MNLSFIESVGFCFKLKHKHLLLYVVPLFGTTLMATSPFLDELEAHF